MAKRPTIRDGIYDLLGSVEIDTKEEGRTHIEPWPSQRMVIDAIADGLQHDVHEFVILKSRQVACCVVPSTRVLTAELQWTRIADLHVGDELVAVDEFPPGGRGATRKMRTATVQATVRMHAMTYRIIFDDGRSVVCTDRHPWLSRKESTDYEWRSIQRTMQGGVNGGNCLTVGTKVRWITKPWDQPSYEDGWFSGFLDGEGSLANANTSGAKVTVSQKHGPVFDRAVNYLENKGYTYGIQQDVSVRESKFGTDPVPHLVITRMDEIFRLLGQTRPTRLWRRFWEDREPPGKKSGIGTATIVGIEPVGEQDVVDLQTSTGTYIAEGFVSHNTTVASVIELFWALANPGTQGCIIADRTDNLERLRRIFASLLETLPREWRSPEHKLVQNNRNGLAFANRSVIDLLAAGSNPDLGASRALNMMHATECSLWRSLAGVESLKASLARQNPNRLYIWESVSNGFNWFWQHCQQAKTDRHMKFIFVGFWANPTYSIPQSDPDFQIYWDGSLTDEEITRARYVKREYGVVVKPEQIAWWRRESEYRAEQYMLRHYPWTEKEAFVASGSGFFPAKRTLELTESLTPAPPYKGYRYIFEDRFLASRIEQTMNWEEVSLRVWETPEPQGVYVIGIDPSGGGGGDSDDHAIQVLRCYADRIVQVAEFQSNAPLTYQIAWVVCHLCGAYRDHTANLEVTGIGAAVLPEVRNLRLLAERGILQGDIGSEKILDMIGCVRWFLYKRPDTLGGAGNIFAWKTNADNKRQIFSELRDSMMVPGRLEIRSQRLAQQLQAIVEDEGWIGAGPDTGEGDDLVFAFVLAHHVWVDTIRNGLIVRNLTWESVHADFKPKDIGNMLSFAFSQKMTEINRKALQRREKF